MVLRHREWVCVGSMLISNALHDVWLKTAWLGFFSRRGRAPSAMPKRRKKEISKGAPGEWVQSLRERVQRQEHLTVSMRGRQPAAFWMEEEEAVEEELQSRASRLDFTAYSVDELLAAYQRLVLSASLKLAAFEPQHYTTMVCGRPVQVIICYISAMCHRFQVLLSSVAFLLLFR